MALPDLADHLLRCLSPSCAVGWEEKQHFPFLRLIFAFIFFLSVFCFALPVFGEGGVSYKLKKCSLWHQQADFML